MIEVCNCGGGTAVKRNLCVLGCPLAPVYKGARGRPPAPRARPKRIVLLGLVVLVGFHQEGERGKEGEGEGVGKGAPPPSLVQFRLLRGGGACGPALAGPLSPLRPMLAH